MLRIITVVAMLLFVPSVAIPCINATMLRGDKATKTVKLADKLLKKGKYKRAMKLVDPMRYEFVDDNLDRRARIIYAVGAMRTSSYRAEQSLAELEGQLRDKGDDPYLSARVAEAMVLRADYRGNGSFGPKTLGPEQVQRMQDEAMDMLVDLDKRDLMPDAMAYATLAQLHQRKGDSEARDASLARCRKMTRRRSICKVHKVR